jgi:hypothetical protein
MEPDLDQLRLQQLLQPFNNQTGVMSTNSAIPMINSIPMINTGMIDQNLQNTDLFQQIIAENQMKANVFSRPNMMNVAGTSLPGGITEIENQMIKENMAPLQNLGFGTNYGVANTPDVIGDLTGSDVYESDDGRPYYIDSKGNKILAPGTVKAYKKQSGYSGQKPSGIAKLFELQKQTHEKIEKLETSIERIEKILIGCAGALLVGMGGVITALIFRF